MTVHIVVNDKPLCGFTNDPPSKWPYGIQAVGPAEAQYCTCYNCMSRLHETGEIGEIGVNKQRMNGG